MAAVLSWLWFFLGCSLLHQGKSAASDVKVSSRMKRQVDSFMSRPFTMVRNSLELMSDITNYFIQVNFIKTNVALNFMHSDWLLRKEAILLLVKTVVSSSVIGCAPSKLSCDWLSPK